MSALRKLSDFISSDNDQPGLNSCPVTALRDAIPIIHNNLKSNGLSEEFFGLHLTTWQGPLEGVAHMRDQFAVLSSSTSAESAASSGQDISEKDLVSDLQLLRRLVEATKDLQYWFKGSESEYGVVPVIFTATLSPQPSIQEYWNHLHIDAELSGRFAEPQVFHNQQDFIRYIKEDHLKLHKDENMDDPDRKKLLTALELLARSTKPPYTELIVGQDGMYNPIPIFWLGTSTTSGHLLGLMSLLVWT